MNAVQIIVFSWLFLGAVCFLIECDRIDFKKMNDEEFLGLMNPVIVKALFFAVYLAIGTVRLFGLFWIWILGMIRALL